VPPPVATRIDERLAAHRDAWPGVRWVAPGDLHVTLAFLGQVPAVAVPGVARDLERLAASTSSFALELSGSGTFGGGRRQPVAWLGIGIGWSPVRDLAVAVDAALGTGAEGESRPHVTVARHAPASLPATLADLIDGARLAWHADELVLYRSHLAPRGSHYEVLARCPFGPSRS
jgi:2'-5' RNA ligase